MTTVILDLFSVLVIIFYVFVEHNQLQTYDVTAGVGQSILEEELKIKKNMSNLKRYALSSLTTFIATFVLAFCTTIGNAGFTFSKASLIALAVSALMIAVRAVAKIGVEWAMGVTGEPTQ